MKLDVFNRGFFFTFLIWIILPCFSIGQTPIFSDPGTTHGNTDAVVGNSYGGVDISNCSSVVFTFDYEFSLSWSGSGNMESADECALGACAGDPNAPNAGSCFECWDFLLVDFLVDGNPVGGDFIGEAGTDDSETSGSITTSFCTGGNGGTASIEALTQNWAGDEAVTYSNISIICYETIPVAMANPTTGCENTPIDLTGSVTDPGAVSTINWTGPGTIDDPSSLNTTVNDLGAGNHTFTLTTTDGNGCSTSSDVMVDISPAPVANSPDPLEVCVSFAPIFGEVFNVATVESQIAGGDPNLTVEWWFDSDATSPILSIDDLLNSPLVFSVWATVTDPNNCRSAAVEVFFDVTTYPELLTTDGTLMGCTDATGSATFNPSDADDQFTGGDGSLTVTYHNSPGDAASGNNPVFGPVITSADLQLFVRVTNGNCATEAVLNLVLDQGAEATEASLDACDEGNGLGLFDFILIEDEVLGSNAGIVRFYEDFDLTTEIFSPYSSPGGIVYAAIDSGDNCISAPVEITLNLISFSTNDFSLSFDPSSGCGSTDVTVTLHAPLDPGGDYSFDVEYAPISTGVATGTTLIGSNGTEALTLNINESYRFTLFGVVSPDPNSCPTDLMPEAVYEILISTAAAATPSAMAVCPEADGQGIYNLLSLHDSINRNSIDTVLFFLDIDLNTSIDTTIYTTAPDTIYAVIDEGGGCISAPVEVVLTLDSLPDFSINLQQPISCTGSSNAILNVQDTIGSIPFMYDWSVNAWDGSTNNTGVGPGQYMLTVTDANMCTSADTITVVDPLMLNLVCHENMAEEGNGIGSYSFTYSGGTADYSLDLVGPTPSSTTSNAPGTWDSGILAGGTYTFTVTDANNCMESCTFVICDLLIDCTQTTSPSAPGGNNGSLLLDIMGGTADYSIVWTGPVNGSSIANASGMISIPNLSAGDYTIIATDANACADTCSFTINPANCTFSVETSSTNINCNGDSTATISFVLNNGVPNYTFVWSNPDLNSTGTNGDQINLPAGDYAVTITDNNNCQLSTNINLTEPPVLVLECHQNGENEGNGVGSYSFTYSGGTPFYILNLNGPVDINFTVNTPDTWDTAALPEGDYTFTLMDANGCSESCDFTIPPPCDLVIDCSNTNAPSTPIASDGSLDFEITGGTPPYNISWMGPVNGSGITGSAGVFPINNLSVGPYTVTVTDANGCEEICGFLINNPECTFVANILGNNISCNGDSTGTISFTFINGAPDYTFIWSDPSLNSQGPGGNQVNLPAGDYTVTVVDSNNCDTTLNITLTEPPAISLSCNAVIHPNQVTNNDGVIDIIINDGPTGVYTISYDNQNGTNGSIAGAIGSNTISNLPEGTYTINVSIGACMESCDVTLIANSCTFNVSILGIDETCIGENDGSATVIASGGMPDYIFNWSTTAATAMINNLSPDTYFVTVTDGNGCLALDTITILAGSPKPTLDYGNPNTSICADSCLSINLTLTGQAPYVLDYIIQNINGPLPLLRQLEVMTNTGILEVCPADLGLNPGALQLQLLTLTDANCDTTIDETILLDYLPPAIGNLDSILCFGESFTLGGILFDENNLAGQVTLQGAASLGCDSLVDVSIQYYEIADTLIEQNICLNDTLMIGGELFHANNLTGNVLLTSANGCDSMITVNLAVSEQLFGNMEVDLCAGDTIVIEGQAFHENLLLDTIPLNILSSSGCDTSLIVTVNLLQAVINSVNMAICPGDSLMIGGQFFHDLLLSDTLILDHAAMNGCDSIIEVNLNLLPIPSFDLVTQICEGDTLFIGDTIQTTAGMMSYTLAGMANNGCDSIVNVDLSFYETATSLLESIICTGDTVTVGDQVFHIDNPSGTVVLAGASENGCDSTVMVNISFLPNVMGSLDTILCFGESLQIGDQTFNTDSPNGVVIFENAAANGCDSTVFVNTTYFDELSASLTGGTVICPGESVDLELVTSNNFTYDYIVEQENGNPLTGTSQMGNQILAVTPTQNTVYTLTLITSTENCPITTMESTAAILVSDLETNAVVMSDFNGFGVSCAGESDGSAQANILTGIGPFSYQWSNNANSATINNLSAGDYSVLVTDGAGCTSESSVSLTSPLEMAVRAQGIADGCFGESGGRITIDTVFNGTAPYEYSLDGEFFSPLGLFPVFINQLASDNYNIVIQDANDCAVTTSILVPAGQELVLELGDDEHIKLGDSVLLNPFISFTPSSWTWTPPDYLSEPDTFITQAAPPESLIYQLELSDENGCTVVDQIRIFVDKTVNIYVPTAFSPNLDGSNDKLIVYTDQNVGMIESFQIYDRWGNLMFSQGPFLPNDPQYGWDGKLNGEPLNAAVFVYFVEATLITGEEVLVKGEVILMR